MLTVADLTQEERLIVETAREKLKTIDAPPPLKSDNVLDDRGQILQLVDDFWNQKIAVVLVKENEALVFCAS